MENLINFTEHLMGDGYFYAYGIAAVDLTGNGAWFTPDDELRGY